MSRFAAGLSVALVASATAAWTIQPAQAAVTWSPAVAVSSAAVDAVGGQVHIETDGDETAVWIEPVAGMLNGGTGTDVERQ